MTSIRENRMSKHSELAEEIAEIISIKFNEREQDEAQGTFMPEAEHRKELAALIDQKLSGVAGGIALISAHIDDVLSGQIVEKTQSLELIKKTADELWQSIKTEE